MALTRTLIPEQSMNVDVIKIDRSFITDIGRDQSSRAIVAKTIELAHLLNLTVVSEGVETHDQHQIVTDLGSDYCQGYYFGRPRGIADDGEFLDIQP